MPYKVLGVYHPAIWRGLHIGRDLTRFTARWKLVPLNAEDRRYHGATWADPALHAHVRRRTLRSEAGEQWHQDGDYGHVPMNHSLVFWSNRAPTEFSVGGKTFQPQPFEVVLFNNLDGLHRRPPTAPRRRWIFRQRVNTC